EDPDQERADPRGQGRDRGEREQGREHREVVGQPGRHRADDVPDDDRPWIPSGAGSAAWGTGDPHEVEGDPFDGGAASVLALAARLLLLPVPGRAGGPVGVSAGQVAGESLRRGGTGVDGGHLTTSSAWVVRVIRSGRDSGSGSRPSCWPSCVTCGGTRH